MKRSVMHQLLFALALLILSYAAIFLFCRQLVKRMTNELAVSEANATAASIAGTVQLIMNESGDALADLQERLGEHLNTVCEENEMVYIYVIYLDVEEGTRTYYALGNGEGAVEASAENTEFGVPFESEASEAELNALVGIIKDGKNTETYKNQYGEVLTAYFPLYDNYGSDVLLVGADISVDRLRQKYSQEITALIWAILPIFLVTSAVIYITLQRKLVAPAKKMSRAMMNYDPSDGGTEKIEIKDSSEFAEMAASFNKMTADISEYLDNIETLTREKHQTALEAEAAAEIQRMMLQPTRYSAGPVSVNAFMQPAKEVGGDLYSYYDDGERIYAVIADVSGKGMAAALMMVKAMTIIGQCCENGFMPSRILGKTNAAIAANNPKMMFITAFAGVYKKSTGIFTYSNAGHNPPYIISKELKKITSEPDMVLGLFDDTEYRDHTVTLLPGDTVFMYTDGVTEATNSDKQLFAESRLEEALSTSGSEKDIPVTEYVYGKIKEFVGDYEQSDDITMISLFVGGQEKNNRHTELCLKSEIKFFSEIRTVIMESGLLSQRTKKRVCLAAEEIFVNICSYAYDGTGEVLFELDINDGAAVMRFSDSGKPFDPLKDIVNIDEYDMTAQEGGLGRFISFNIADSADYCYSDNKNILTVTIKEEK